MRLCHMTGFPEPNTPKPSEVYVVNTPRNTEKAKNISNMACIHVCKSIHESPTKLLTTIP